MHDVLALLFFFNDTATTEIYTLSLHDALPVCTGVSRRVGSAGSEWPESIDSLLPARSCPRLRRYQECIGHACPHLSGPFLASRYKCCRICHTGVGPNF